MAAVLAENYQLKWHSHGTHLHSSIATLQRSESFSDVTLATVDGHYVSAHRFILSACSSYLHHLFRTMGLRVGSPNVVVILPCDISYKTLSILLQYMYSGEATVSNEQLNGVLKAGEILRIKGLCHNSSGSRDRERDREASRPSSNSSAGSHRVASGVLTQHNQHEGTSRRKQSEDGKLQSGDASLATPGEGQRKSSGYNLLKIGKPSKSDTQTNELNPDGRMSASDDSNQDDNQKENSDDSRTVSAHLNKKQRLMDENATDIEQNMQIELLVKEEPIEWVDIDEAQGNDENDDDDDKDLHPDMIIKPDTYSGGEDEEDLSEFYAPLTCDMCHETFTTPALWVKHIEKHPPTELPKRKGKRNSGAAGSGFKLMKCDVCSNVYNHPAEWARHIQTAHTEDQIAQSNKIAQLRLKPIIELQNVL